MLQNGTVTSKLKKNGSIVSLMSNAQKDTIIKSREYIKAIVDILLLIARQGLS